MLHYIIMQYYMLVLSFTVLLFQLLKLHVIIMVPFISYQSLLNL